MHVLHVSCTPIDVSCRGWQLGSKMIQALQEMLNLVFFLVQI